MDEIIKINECLTQVLGAWTKENDRYKYVFQIFPYESEDKENIYELHAIDTITGDIAYTYYSISFKTESCFIEFLGTTYKVLHIDNSIKIPKMELEVDDGNIVIFEKRN